MNQIEKVARAAKERGISYRNNAALMAFLVNIAPLYALPTPPAGGSDTLGKDLLDAPGA